MVITLFTRSEADVNLKADDEMTALHFAVQVGGRMHSNLLATRKVMMDKYDLQWKHCDVCTRKFFKHKIYPYISSHHKVDYYYYTLDTGTPEEDHIGQNVVY